MDRAVGALFVPDPEPGPVVVAEIELGRIAADVRLADVEVAAVDAALEDREEVLDGVGVPEDAPDILLGTVVHRAVPAERGADAGIDGALVGHKVAGTVHVGVDDRAKSGCGHVGDMEAAHAAITLHKGQNDGLWRDVVLSIGRLPADVGFVGLNDLVLSAKRSVLVDAKVVMASRMRCPRNHAVFMLPPKVRWSWRVLMPFLLEHIR
jgi:hypothetical protein